MTRPVSSRSPTIALTAAAAIAALASVAPSPAAAQDYDIDCKLLLCLPGGFPSGCSDAFDHMIDRLRDGKSPIGFCAMSNGDAYDAFEVDYRTVDVTSPQGWDCPEGKHLYHRTTSPEDGYWSQTVNTFCYDSLYQRTGWQPNEGTTTVTTFVNKTPPERRDVWVNLTLEPDTPSAFTEGWQAFDSGRGSNIRTAYNE